MQEIINRIIGENFDNEGSKPEFSCSNIELSVKKGESLEGSFRIIWDAGKICEGKIYSSDSRMECLTEEFEGNDAEILYRFNGRYAEEGEVIKGSFSVIGNGGEHSLPFTVSILGRMPESTEGEIKNLFLFTNLAKRNWAEAVKLFYSTEFEEMLQTSDTACLESYRGLSANKGNEQNMEEFLIHANKKQKVEYFVNVAEIDISARVQPDADSLMEREIEISKKGWGYTAVNIECDGEFVFTNKEFLSDDDFLGSRCRLPVFIDTQACHFGRNYGKICLFNSYFFIEIPVVVHIGINSEIRRTATAKKQMTAKLMNSYVDYRLKKIKKNNWLKEAGKYAERMAAMDENDIEARLFQIQVLLTEERYDEAAWFMDHVEELFSGGKERNDTLWAYYQYLSTLLYADDDNIREARQEIKKVYHQNKSDWRAAWLLLYLEDEYTGAPEKAFAFLEKQFEQGCTSPVIYLEALLLINNYPSLLRKPGDFELQVLNFGFKRDALTVEVEETLLLLSSRAKAYSVVLFRMLTGIYEKNYDARILKEICGLLIKGDRHGEKYLYWYREGAGRQLRITNIYEYYMMSVDTEKEEEVPEPVLLYFSYQAQLDYVKRAFLYRYVYERRDEIWGIYEKYEQTIWEFVREQIERKHINRNLAVLYQAMLTADDLDTQLANSFSGLLFTENIQISDYRIKKLFVYQWQCEKPVEYDVQNKTVYAEIYGEGNTLVFEDAYGNRFVDGVEYDREKMMSAGDYLQKLNEIYTDNIQFDRYLLENIGSRNLEDKITADRAMDLAESGILRKQYMWELLLKLLEYHYENDNLRDVDRCIRMADETELDAATRGIMLKYVIALGKYDFAYDWLKKYGPYFVEPGMMVKLLDEFIARTDMEDGVILSAASYCLEQGRYGSSILRYLVHYYKGMTRNMRDIWKAAGSFEVDAYELSERMLVQMMHTGTYVEEKLDIFKNYVSNGAKEEVEKAFLMSCSYDYFVKERLTDGIVFDEIKRMYDRKEEIPFVCKLAYLKYYAENLNELGKNKLLAVREFLREMTEEKIYLNFFKKFDMCGDILKWMEDKTIVEYRTHPGGKARIHFCLVQENGEAGEYLSEYMRDVYGGACFKDFVLFFGEKLKYYIMEETDRNEQLTESGTLRLDSNNTDIAESRFRMINDMAMSKAIQDYDTLDGLMEEFFRNEFYNGELFKLE